MKENDGDSIHSGGYTNHLNHELNVSFFIFLILLYCFALFGVA